MQLEPNYKSKIGLKIEFKWNQNTNNNKIKLSILMRIVMIFWKLIILCPVSPVTITHGAGLLYSLPMYLLCSAGAQFFYFTFFELLQPSVTLFDL